MWGPGNCSPSGPSSPLEMTHVPSVCGPLGVYWSQLSRMCLFPLSPVPSAVKEALIGFGLVMLDRTVPVRIEFPPLLVANRTIRFVPLLSLFRTVELPPVPVCVATSAEPLPNMALMNSSRFSPGHPSRQMITLLDGCRFIPLTFFVGILVWPIVSAQELDIVDMAAWTGAESRPVPTWMMKAPPPGMAKSGKSYPPLGLYGPAGRPWAIFPTWPLSRSATPMFNGILASIGDSAIRARPVLG